MSTSTADLQKAIVTVWSGSGLDALFQSYLPAGTDSSRFAVLNDQEAAPKQPYPYCVMDQPTSDTTDKMSAGVNGLRMIRDITIRFNVFARRLDGAASSAKEVAALLAEEIQKVFGGHPTQSPTGAIELDNGNHLITDILNDFAIRVDDNEYQWVLEYRFRIDVPVAV